MIVHPFWLETITVGVRRVHAHSGELLGEVWRRTSGDFLPMKPYGAAMTPTDRDDALQPIGIYATETEAIAAVIRWCLDLLGDERAEPCDKPMRRHHPRPSGKMRLLN